MTSRQGLCCLALMLLQATFASPGRPQDQTTITGTVRDSIGSALPNANVVLTDANHEKRTTKTDATGVFRFSPVPPGHYSLEVSADGFSTLRQDVDVALNQTATLKLALNTSTPRRERSPSAPSHPAGPPVSGEASAAGAAIGARRIEEPDVQPPPPPPPPPPTASRPASAAPPPSAAVGALATGVASLGQNYVDMKVFYATDRKPTGKTDPGSFYGTDRGPDDLFALGTCHVSIPRDHRVGQLESPKFWKLQFRQNPNRDVVLLSVLPSAEADFYNDLSASVQATEEKKAFVFVHGYDTSFEDAARRTAQLAYDLRFKGVPLFYSWPSKADVTDYLADEATIDWVRPHLKEFLEQVAAHTDAGSIYLVAHSMGNRILTRALADIVSEHLADARPRFKEVILAAPDVDAGEFRQLAKVFPSSARHVTLYASSNDKALVASKLLHDYMRAGESGDHLVVVPGIDTIDVSAIDTGLLGHSYVADNGSVITDIFYLLSGTPASRRACLNPRPLADLAYWFYGPPGSGTCPVPLPALPTP